jgi:hypothetical protein
MRWRVEGRPNRLEDNLWGFGIVRGRRSRQIRARVDAEVAKLRGGGPEELAVELVQSHLNDRVPPHEVALVPGWNYVRQEPAAGEMGFTQSPRHSNALGASGAPSQPSALAPASSLDPERSHGLRRAGLPGGPSRLGLTVRN